MCVHDTLQLTDIDSNLEPNDYSISYQSTMTLIMITGNKK